MNNRAKVILDSQIDFSQIIENGEYYVDKTQFIRSIYEDGSKVSLYTRPRCFGKTLMMNVLRTFFELDYVDPGNLTAKQAIFSNFRIGQDYDFCAKHLARYPVIYISFKNVTGKTFHAAADRLRKTLIQVVKRYQFLAESPNITELERNCFIHLLNLDTANQETALGLMRGSLSLLEALLCRHFDRRVILLIDDCDAPLQNAYRYNYYSDMLDLIRAMLSPVFKDNVNLEKAVLTGILRLPIDDEFYGFNQIVCNSVTSSQCSAAFGFTEKEAEELLYNFGLQDGYEDAKAYYCGYKFGGESIFCPWDLIRFCLDNLKRERLLLRNYWGNAFDGGIIADLIKYADIYYLELLKKMLRGEEVLISLNDELSVSELNVEHSSSMLLSLLFSKGYFTKVGDGPAGELLLRIPNREVCASFENEIRCFFRQRGPYFKEISHRFGNAVCEADAFEADLALSEILVRFSGVRDCKSDSFCPGLVRGLLSVFSMPDSVKGPPRIFNLNISNKNGLDYSEISFADAARRQAVILCLKRSESSGAAALLTACQSALEQIRSRSHEKEFALSGSTSALLCGIAYSGKDFRILMEEPSL